MALPLHYSGEEVRCPVQFIRTRQVLLMIGVGRTTLWRMVQEGNFPKPVRITERSAGYLLEAVEHWMRTRAEGRPWDAPAESNLRGTDPTRLPGRRLALPRSAAHVRG